MKKMNTHQQSGVALVLTLVILVMLLMLALPFALSQNASIQSSDQFANAQDVHTARESLEAFGLGLATDGFSTVYLDPDNSIHHAIKQDTENILDPTTSGVLGSSDYEGDNYPLRMYLDMDAIRENVWGNTEKDQLDLELIVEDESGKIDMNALSANQWLSLLRSLGINYLPNQLAHGFVNYRYHQLNGKPYTQLEQLLEATPSGSPGRPALTHAELDRIRPYVTAYGMGQGKDGHQELGNALAVDDPSSPGNKYAVLDTHPSKNITVYSTNRVYVEDPDYHTTVNAVTSSFAVACSPIAQALNVNTASAKALNFIGIGDISPLIASGRTVYTDPADLPEALRDRIGPIDDRDNTNPNDDVETIPLSIQSSGVVSIRTRAQKQDRSNKPSAQSKRDVIAMALSGNAPLEKKWDDQLAFQLNVVNRKSSQLNTWPRAIDRRNDNHADIGPNWKDLAADPDDKTDAAVKPKVLPDIYSSAILRKDWEHSFTFRDEDVPAPFTLEDDVTPEGIVLDAGVTYEHEEDLGGKKSFMKPDFVAGGDPQLMQPRQISFWITTPKESDFNSKWIDKTVPLLELRAPEANTGIAIDPTGPKDGHSTWDPALTDARGMDPRVDFGDNSKQHYVGLYYDGTNGLEHFVLTVAGEIVEFPSTPFGAPFFPQDDPATDNIDERTLGRGTHPLVNPQRLTWSEHRYIHALEPDTAYQVTVILQNSQPGGLQFFINGLVGRDLTQLDNLNVSEIYPGDHFTTPYPLQLVNALPEVVQTMTPGSSTTDEAMREVASIRARGLNLPSAWSSILASPSDWLPDNSSNTAHGMININGEFIAYENWSESGGVVTFQNCKRGKRQFVNDPNDQANGLPTEPLDPNDPMSPEISSESYRRYMPAHAAKSHVWPGGVSFERDTALFRGGCALMTPIGDGSSTDQRIRSTVSNGPIDGTEAQPNIQVADASLFPDRGIIKVTGRSPDDNYPPSPGTWDDDSDPTTPEVPMSVGDGRREPVVDVMYYRKNGNTLEVKARYLFGCNLLQTDMITVDPDDPTRTYNINVALVSWEIETDPTGRYNDPGEGHANGYSPGYRAGEEHNSTTAVDASTGKTTAVARDNAHWIPHDYLQLYDVTDASSPSYGGIEWIRYTDIETIDPSSFGESGGPEYYFLNRNGGYGSARGQLGTNFDPSIIWPAGTRLIPVQRAGRHGYLLEPGDLITIAAKQLGANNITYRNSSGVNTRKTSSWQTIVRYVGTNTTDYAHWGVDPSTGLWTQRTSYPKQIRFAFTEELPELNESAIISVWPSWSNTDFTLYDGIANLNPNQFNATNFPFINAWADNFSTDNRKVHFGKQDTALFPSSPGWVNNMPGVLNDFSGTLDQFQAHTPISGSNHQLGTIVSLSGNTIVVTASSSNGFGNRRQDKSGFILIRGEVMAYNMLSNPSGGQATLTIIGRSLLGSEQNNAIQVGDDVMRLPLGNVAQLNQDIDATTIGIVDLVDIPGISNDTSIFDGAHSFLLCKPNGERYEMVQLLAERNRFHTAPWLRGMYNTPVQDWSANDLVIAWYPRYPSALPKIQTHLTTQDEQSALLRSRSYAWAGAPLRIFGMELQGTPSDPSAEVIIDHNPVHAFDFELRALENGYDWAASSTPMASTPAASALDGAALAVPPQFTSNWKPDGGDFEMRVHWRYPSDPYDASDPEYQQLQAVSAAGNSMPSIKSIELKATAKPTILDASVER